MKKIYQNLIVLVLAIIAAILLHFFDPSPCSYQFHKAFYLKDYKGIVTEIYIDKKNHANKTIKCIYIDNEKKQFRVLTPLGNENIYNIINYGDTLMKYPDSHQIIIKGSENDTLSYDLKYPEGPDSEEIPSAWFKIFH